MLADDDDDLVLELAFAANCQQGDTVYPKTAYEVPEP